MSEEPRITVLGKQLKLDGEHLADVRSDMAAAVVADCINYAGLPMERWPRDARDRVESYFA